MALAVIRQRGTAPVSAAGEGAVYKSTLRVIPMAASGCRRPWALSKFYSMNTGPFPLKNQ